MGSVAYRDRDRDRYDDARTSVSSARRGDRDRDGGYTTVKRYIIKDDDSRSAYGRGAAPRLNDRGAERVEETRIVRREVDEPLPQREVRREEPRYQDREIVIRRDRDNSPPRREYYQPRREPETTDRELVIRRTTERDEPRYNDRELDVARITDRRDYRDEHLDYEVLSPARKDFQDRDLQRYTRTAEYYAPQPPPQTIIIRQEPIIIRERIRDDDYQMVRRSDVDDERSVVRREPDRPREEEYFYEKKVRERIDDPRRDRDDDYYEGRSMRREVSPHDSVSQVGRRGRDDYESDDSMVYVRKEVREDDGYRSDSSDDHQKRDLAAGVLAGVGAAELLRNHRKKEGREATSGAGRIGRDVGAGALGALAAEGIRRAKSRYGSRSRHGSRDRSGSRDRVRSRSRRRRRSSSGSNNRLETLGKVGLGAAALAAAAAFAKSRMNKDDDSGEGRSRSRVRRGSGEVGDLATDVDAPDGSARNPKHRNIRMAEAGAAGAAVAGLIERARSKSRARDGRGEEQDKSVQGRIKQALPVVAAGLGSAALAGLYEKNKAKKEAEEHVKEERRRSRTRSRSRPRSEYYDGPRGAAGSDPNLIEYGDGPMYGNNFGPDYYGRPPPQEQFYNNQTAMVQAPEAAAAGAAGGYGAARGARPRSVSRDRGSRRSVSSSSDGGSRRRRKRSRDKNAAAAAGTAAAVSEHERRKQERRERKARRRE